MPTEDQFSVIDVATLSWPAVLQIPSRRFRLFVAADVTRDTTEVISEFTLAALKSGMVYFCAWGPDCSRFHDIVDEVILGDDLDERLFVGQDPDDLIMTTWHERDPLNEALDFFINWAQPSGNFRIDSDHWVAVCVNNPEWAAEIRQQLGHAEFRA
jgi:hypothetical protein